MEPVTAFLTITIILMLGFIGFSALSLKFQRRLHSETVAAVGAVFAIFAGLMLSLTATIVGGAGTIAVVSLLAGALIGLAFWTSIRPTIRAWYRLWRWKRYTRTQEEAANTSFYDA